jgi:hypothetical protein
MIIMKTFKLFILLNILTYTAYSQCVYTPGKSTIELCNDDGVIIGGSLGCSACIKWTPATGLDDPYKLNPKANPQSTTTYTLEIYDDEFNSIGGQSVTVIVDKNKQITGISAAPECCYKTFSGLDANNLHITTTPSGLEYNVEIDPGKVPIGPYTLPVPTWEYPVEVTLKNTCGDKTLTETVTITAVNEDLWQNTGYAFGKLGKVSSEIDKAIDKALGLVPPGSPCKGEWKRENQLRYRHSTACCKDAGCSVEGIHRVQGYYEGGFYFKCDWPVAGIPYIASVDVRFKLEMRARFSADWLLKCDQQDVCLDVYPIITIGGGIAGKLLGGYALDASLLLVAEGSVTDGLKFCMLTDTNNNVDVCGQVLVRGEVVLLSAIKHRVDYPLVKKKCINN